MDRIKLMRWNVVIGVCVVCVAWLAGDTRRLGAQNATPPQRKSISPTEAFGKLSKGRAISPAAARPRTPYQLNISALYYWDLDNSGDLTELEPTVGTGNVYLNGTQVGIWHTSGEYTGYEILGQIQVVLTKGSFTVSTGLASNGGIRSGITCFPIVGGTGTYSKLSGNCGFGFDSNNFYLLPNAK